ncbi:MAG: hypothetical protein P4L22_05715 [Candidatus Babeliales bacterium]|nr:hypothetical protein [Candidatus Babeliales bacterium]
MMINKRIIFLGLIIFNNIESIPLPTENCSVNLQQNRIERSEPNLTSYLKSQIEKTGLEIQNGDYEGVLKLKKLLQHNDVIIRDEAYRVLNLLFNKCKKTLSDSSNSTIEQRLYAEELKALILEK